MLDPMSALSLVGGISQLVDFSSQLISKSNALSQPGARDFSNAVAELRRGEAIMQQVNLALHRESLSENDDLLLRLIKQYMSLAEELIAILEAISSSPGLGTWKSFRQAIKSSRYKNKVADLERRMSRVREDIHFLVILQSSHTAGVESKFTIERKDTEVPVNQMSQLFQSNDVPTSTSIQRALDNIQKPQNSAWFKGKLLDPPDQEPVQTSDLSTLEQQGEDAHQDTVRTAATNLVHVLIEDNGLKRLLLSAITRVGKVAFEAKLKEFFSDLSTITKADKGSEWLMKRQPRLLATLLSDKLIPVTVEGIRKQPGSDFDLESKDAMNRLQRRHGMDNYDVPDSLLALLSDSTAIQRSLSTSEIFSSIYEAFQRDIFLRPGELISRVLNQHLLDEMRHEVSCHIEWQLVEYLRQEFPNTSCFNDIFTITGELDMAWGTTMREYMAKTWSTGTGETLCDILQKILLHKSFNKGMSS